MTSKEFWEISKNIGSDDEDEAYDPNNHKKKNKGLEPAHPMASGYGGAGPRSMGYGNMNNMGPTGPMNPYTYNGKLQEKPESNFLPRTSDFSAFAK
eukprot:g13842.t1